MSARRHVLTCIPGLLLAAACGDDGAGPIDGPPRIDAATIDADPDAPDVPPDARPDAAVQTCTPQKGTTVTTVEVFPQDTFDSPVLVTAPIGDRRLFVVEQPGTIRIVDEGVVQPTPFVNLRSSTGGPVLDSGNEQGLLGLAFHPDYADNGRLFVYYTRDPDGANVVAELRRAPGGATADAASLDEILEIPDDRSNHNGGMIEFGPDGYLYIGTGDGGGGGDPDDNAEDLGELLGKMLRIDVDNPQAPLKYGIPASNPFVDTKGARGEIWAYGLRNPWRWSFDAANGDLYIGDVGQDQREEFDHQPASSTGGENYGWDPVEGSVCYEAGCTTAGTVLPVHDYAHGQQSINWCSAVGGVVYRGTCNPDLQGWYFYSDYCHSRLWAWTAGAPADHRQVTNAVPGGGITSIYTDALGELYITQRNGAIRRIAATE